MLRLGNPVFFALTLILATAVHAQTRAQTTGTVVVVPATGEVRQANDEVTVTFMLEEQDKDKTVAASRVNQKMKQGIEIIKREDSQAALKSYGYYTYGVYPEESPKPVAKTRQPVSWRVGQYLEVRTSNLDHLPKTVAAGQRVLALNGLQFGLSSTALRKLDQKRIEAAYENLTERIGFVAKAMGRNIGDAAVENVDLEASGRDGVEHAEAKFALRAASQDMQAQVTEPSFEAGETVLQMSLVAKVRFK